MNMKDYRAKNFINKYITFKLPRALNSIGKRVHMHIYHTIDIITSKGQFI